MGSRRLQKWLQSDSAEDLKGKSNEALEPRRSGTMYRDIVHHLVPYCGESAHLSKPLLIVRRLYATRPPYCTSNLPL